jgi:tetratricopeptide (TPR) repeat protein
MRHFYLFFFQISLLLLTSTAYSFDKIDSLRNVLLTTKSDTVRITALTEIGYFYWSSSLDSLLKYNQAAFQLAEDINFEKGKMRPLLGLGIYHWQKGEYGLAREKYMLSLTLSKKYKNLKGIADAYYNIGILHSEEGDFPQAMNYFLNGLTFYEKAGEKGRQAHMLNSIAIIHQKEKRFEKSLQYFTQALAIFQQVKDLPNIAGTISNIGSLYFDQKQYEKAREQYIKALDLFKKIDNKKGMILSINFLGYCGLKMSKPSQAVTYYVEAIKLNEKLISEKFLLTSHIGLGEAYRNLKKYEQSVYHYNFATSMAKSNNLKPTLLSIYQGLSDVYADMGDFKKAYSYKTIYHQTKDSVYNEENSKKIADLQASFDIAKKQSEIDLIKRDRQIQTLAFNKQKLINYFSLAGLAFLMIISGVTLNRYQLKKKSNKLLSIQNQEINDQKKQIEFFNKQLRLQALKAQMDPHFIFNSLSAIQHFILINDGESSLAYLTKFSKLIRQILENAHNRQLCLHDEIVFLEYYLQLEKLRFHDRFDYQIQVDKSIDAYRTQIPTLLLQPYLENAIVHGITHKEAKGNVALIIEKREKHLLCVIEDDGVGREKAAELKRLKANLHKSRGMIVNKERLEIINEGMADKVSLHIIDLVASTGEAAGTRVEIQIPVEIY